MSRFTLQLAVIGLSLCAVTLGQNTVMSVISGVNGDSAQSLSTVDNYPADTIFGALKLKQNWGFWYATEIDGTTCKVVSTGKFTPSNGPHYGDLSYKVVPHTIPTGTCKGKTVDYNLATYVWTKTTAAEPQDFFHIQWQTPDGSQAALDMLPELIPTGEITQFRVWSNGTVGVWRVQLQPKTVNYDGVHVREKAPFTQKETCSPATSNNCSPDTCWFHSSRYDPQIEISDPNGTLHIPVENGNHWNDIVGWGSGLVTWYRSQGRTARGACGTTYPQQMQIQFATGDPNWYNYGPVNTLGGSFTNTKVTSTRAGVSETETWQ